MKGGKAKSEGKKKLSVKKTDTKASAKASKSKKDPNKPKRPPSAFFVFMEEFRPKYIAENPENKAITAVGKAGGAKWKSMTEEEKAPFVAKAEKRKAEYEKKMNTYNKEQAEGADKEESDKSMSEVNDEEEDED